jgi:hypothetical protein
MELSKRFVRFIRNDSLFKILRLRTTLCLDYPPEVIACGAIQLAAEDLDFYLPIDPPWCKLFDAELDQVSLK